MATAVLYPGCIKGVGGEHPRCGLEQLSYPPLSVLTGMAG